MLAMRTVRDGSTTVHYGALSPVHTIVASVYRAFVYCGSTLGQRNFEPAIIDIIIVSLIK